MADVWDAIDSRPGVRRTAELERVARLPRRRLDLTNVVDLTDEFLVRARCLDPGCDLCDGGRRDARLTPAQSVALAEARTQRGLFAELPVGSGKTLLGVLLAVATRGDRPVFLMPPRTYKQVRDVQLPRIARHFRTHPRMELVPYSRLRAKDGADVLPRLAPDRLILDEAHAMRYRTTKQTKAVLWFMKSNPSTLCYLMTGTPGSKLEHYYHLLDLALRAGSPLPRRYPEAAEWGQAADDDVEDRLAPGALLRHLAEDCAAAGCGAPATRADASDPDAIGPRAYCERHGGGGRILDDVVLARRAIRQRYRDTRGVAWADAQDCPASLVLVRSAAPAEPDAVRRVRVDAERTWVIGDEEIPDGAAMWRTMRQLALGFYYRWDWPGGRRDHAWLRARQDWHRACREYLARAARPGVDSEGTLRAAVHRGEAPMLRDVLAAWERARDATPPPPTVPVWLSSHAVEHAVAWARRTAGVVWYEPVAFGDALRAAGLEALGQGEAARVLELAARPREERVPVALSYAHAEGMNLQRWDRALVMSAPAGARQLEQLLGRHHRRGQRSDEVAFTFALGARVMRSCLDGALAEARETQQKLTSRQKALAATWLDDEGQEEDEG